jgi:hypothetical protein
MLNYKKLVTDKIIKKLFIEPITMNQLRDQLKSTKPKKSSSSDHITMSFIKNNQVVLEPLILSIINITINTSIYPDQLKISRIIPILKKGKAKTNARSFRPINILPSVSKILEKLLANLINDHLERNHLIPGQHHGGRANHSTTTAVTTLIDNWANQLQSNTKNAVIVIDQSAAYDLIDHFILIKKLRVLGLTTKALNLMESFLSGRQQQVTVDGLTSDRLHVRPVSVVQGSVLSGILFLIYTLDMPLMHHNIMHDAVSEANCTMPSSSSFVDDWVLTIRETATRPLQQGIDETMLTIAEYMKSNKLAMNSEKTQLMVIARDVTSYRSLIIKNDNPDLIVKPVHSIRLLGITIASDLRWNNYLLSGKDSLVKQLRKRNTMLAKVCHFTTKQNRLKLANGIFASKLLYGIEAWGSAPNYLIQKIQAQQTKSMHIIHGYKSLKWNRTKLLKESKWLNMELTIKLTSLKFTHKILNGKGPQQLMLLMKPPENPSARITRSTKPGKLGVKPASLGRTNYTKYIYRNLAYSQYSLVPSELTDIKSIVNFRKRTKRYLINQDDLPQHRCQHLNCLENINCHLNKQIDPRTQTQLSPQSLIVGSLSQPEHELSLSTPVILGTPSNLSDIQK